MAGIKKGTAKNISERKEIEASKPGLQIRAVRRAGERADGSRMGQQGSRCSAFEHRRYHKEERLYLFQSDFYGSGHSPLPGRFLQRY